MKRPKIKSAMIAIFSIIGLIVGGFATYSLNRLGAVNDNVGELATNWMPSLKAANDLTESIAKLRVAFRDHLLQDGEAEIQNAEERVKSARVEVTQNIADYEALDAEKSDTAITDELRSDFVEYMPLVDRFLVLSRENKDELAKTLLYSQMTPIANKIVGSANKLVAINQEGAQAAYASSQKAYTATLMMTFVAIGICCIVLAASVWFGISGVARPIERITASMKRLAAGDSVSVIPYDGRADEIGEMAGAVEVFRANAVANQRLEQEASIQRSVSEEQKRKTAEAERIRADEMAQATAGLGEGLKHLAGGDLTFHLSEPFADDFETLRADFNTAVSQLSETLKAVADATSTIDTGTREISQSADDLSKRTEQQAASLEETAAALDQITANVTNSSRRAEEARTIALQANASAVHSGKVVSNAVDAMEKISQSSNQVSNIIGVIDEIAFQTNLLALNAGVEAARAGEAGKGFAVVAQEVRELAQRSAQAAKEIKDLIRTSASEVQTGVQLVSDTGEALKTIEGFIVAVNQHMDAIAISAKEQSVGLTQVNTAVNEMDQVTQQNAAMVEETNAAGAALAGEAGRLRDLIGRFQLAAGLRHTAAAMAVANIQHRPVLSPARNMVGRVAKAFSSNAATKGSWEEF